MRDLDSRLAQICAIRTRDKRRSAQSALMASPDCATTICFALHYMFFFFFFFFFFNTQFITKNSAWIAQICAYSESGSRRSALIVSPDRADLPLSRARIAQICAYWESGSRRSALIASADHADLRLSLVWIAQICAYCESESRRSALIASLDCANLR